MFKQTTEKIILVFKTFKKYFIAFGCLLTLLSLFKIFSFSFCNHYSKNTYTDYFDENYRTFSIRIPKNLTFAGEKIPTTDFSVRESMERELIINTYWQSQSLLLHKRANRWFPIIEPILKKHNIPNDFKYLAMIESQLTNAVSPQGATGFWQLLESTAEGYGLEVTKEVDERYNVTKSTEAACKYFREAHKLFKNWTLVAASYNLGMSGIQAQMKKQRVNNYYDLALTEETARFVYRILAMKEIISRPRVYGFMIRKQDLYPSVLTKKIMVDSSIHNLANFAIAQRSNYKMLKLFNPWLLTNTLTNPDKKKYIIELPRNGSKIYDLEGNYIFDDTLKRDSTAPFSRVIFDSIKKYP